MVLVDTSSWIHFLRVDGNPMVRNRVARALKDGDACWCPIVSLKLWNGAGGERERSVLRQFERVMEPLSIDDTVWSLAQGLAREARRQGIPVPATDLLIAACARHHGAELETADAGFGLLKGLRVSPER